MSALAGIVAMDGDVRIDPADVEVMLRAMATRMPYALENAAGSGGWFAAGRIAYGPDADQRASAGGPDAITVFFVGELWNDEARTFANDAEYLLSRYRERRDVPASELNGSFAAVIADPAQQCVILVTDHANSCPIFVAESQGVLYFASEVKGITALSRLPCRPDAASVVSMMACGQLLNLRTLVEGIHRLEYASVWRLGKGTVRKRQYWQFHLEERPVDRGPRRYAADLQAALRGAVRRCLRAGRTGLLLSGGLDSRMILAFLERPDQTPAVAYTARDPSCRGLSRDIAVARRVAEMVGTSLHVARYSGGQVLEAIRGSVIDSDGGAGFTHPVPSSVWDGLRERQGYQYLLIGDECFGQAGGPARDEDVLDVAAIRPLRHCRSLLPFLNPQRTEEFLELSDRECARVLQERKGRHPLNQIDELWYTQGLGQLFAAMRRNLARHGIQVRRPLLEREVLELLQTIPPRYRVNKWIQRRVLALEHEGLSHLPRARFSEAVDYREHFAALEHQGQQVSAFVLRDCPLLADFLDTERVSELIQTVARSRTVAAQRGFLMSASYLMPVRLRSWLVARARYYLRMKSPYFSSPSALLLQIATVAEILRHIDLRCRRGGLLDRSR